MLGTTLLAIGAALGAACDAAQDRGAGANAPPDIRAILEDVAAAMDAPALAAAVVEDGKVVAADVYGRRHAARPDAAARDDRFHIGSLTKPMTAMLIFRLIDAGELGLDTTLARALPDVPMRDEYKGATIEQLLSFRAGIPAYTRIGPRMTPILFEAPDAPAEQQRERFVAHVLQEPPVAEAGGEPVYSNASYAVLALIARRKTGKSWEDMVRTWVFEPMGLKSAGFGDPGRSRPENVVGHLETPDGLRPLDDRRPMPSAAALAPAGDVHLSIEDLGRFAYELVLIGRGESRLLKPETQRLMGRSLPLGEGSLLMGGGGAYTAGLQLLPSRKKAIVAATNRGEGDPIIEAVISRISGVPRPRRAGFLSEATPDGVVVKDVLPGSPAEEAGLKPGDVVLRINGSPAEKSPDGLRKQLSEKSPAEVEVRREGKTLVLSVMLE